MKSAKSFWVIVKDYDKNLFNVIGPLFNDTDIIHQVTREQEKGREVRCQSDGTGRLKDEVIHSWAQHSGQTFTTVNLL